MAKGARAWVAHHIGDLKNWETLRSFRAGIEHFERAVRRRRRRWSRTTCTPTTSRRATRSSARASSTSRVQHHHAHLAACLAEHGEQGPAVGAIFDGTGYGTDGTVWGGELLVGDLARLRARRPLFPVRLPGGDARRARAVADGLLVADGCAGAASPSRRPRSPPACPPSAGAQVAALAVSGTAAPVTTSAGRLFDAVAALCGVRAEVELRGPGRGRAGGGRRRRRARDVRAARSTGEAPLPCSTPARP